jgi:hypothetical protein
MMDGTTNKHESQTKGTKEKTMKKTVFKAFVTAVALALGVCSFATMPTGRILNVQEKIALRGQVTICKHCVADEGCRPKQDVPSSCDPKKDWWTSTGKRKKILICEGKPSSRTQAWSNTEQVTLLTVKYLCEGTTYRCEKNPDFKSGIPETESTIEHTWKQIERGNTEKCGTFSYCIDELGGLDDGVDTRTDYQEQCAKEEPPKPPGE